MNIKIIVGLFVFVVIVCAHSRQNGFAQTTFDKIVRTDTIIGRKTITNEIAGSAYRKRAIGYFVITGQDTSDYTCIFMEFKDGGKFGIDFNHRKSTKTYRQRIDEIRMILPEAAKDFDLTALTSITFGRLILSGDLAIDITNQYQQKFGTGKKTVDYSTAREFLMKSKLVTDWNDLLAPYSVSIRNISMEHLFFTTKEELYGASKIETDTKVVPDKILDCLTWISLAKRE